MRRIRGLYAMLVFRSSRVAGLRLGRCVTHEATGALGSHGGVGGFRGWGLRRVSHGLRRLPFGWLVASSNSIDDASWVAMPVMRYLTRLCNVCPCAFLRLVCVCINVRRCAGMCVCGVACVRFLWRADLAAPRGMTFGIAQSVGTDFVSPQRPRLHCACLRVQ
jgi:hypothetical protein